MPSKLLTTDDRFWLRADDLVASSQVTVDVRGRDAEVKLLLGCTTEEAETAAAFHNSRPDGTVGALLVLRH